MNRLVSIFKRTPTTSATATANQQVDVDVEEVEVQWALRKPRPFRTPSKVVRDNCTVTSAMSYSRGGLLIGTSLGDLHHWIQKGDEWTLVAVFRYTAAVWGSRIISMVEFDELTILTGHPDGQSKWVWRDTESNRPYKVIFTASKSKAVNCLVKLKQKSWMVVGGWGESIVAWYSPNGISIREYKRFQGHRDDVTSLCETPSGIIVSGSRDCEIKLWDIKEDQAISTLKGHTNAVQSLAFIRNNVLVSGSTDKSIKFWNLKEGTCTKTITEHLSNVRSIFVLKSNGTIVSGSWDGSLKGWDLQGRCVFHCNNGEDQILAGVVELPSDGTVACVRQDGVIKFWKVTPK